MSAAARPAQPEEIVELASPFAKGVTEIACDKAELFSVSDFCDSVGKDGVPEEFRRRVLSCVPLDDSPSGIIFVRRMKNARSLAEVAQLIGFKSMPLHAAARLVEEMRTRTRKGPPRRTLVLFQEERRLCPVAVSIEETRTDGQDVYAFSDWKDALHPGDYVAWFGEH